MISLTRISALAAAVMALAAAGSAQARAQQAYALVDPGTFGGPSSFLDLPAVPITSQGTLLGAADTATADSDYPNCPPPGGCFDSYIQHALEWRNGQVTDLGALPGNNSSAIYELNDHGVGAGFSENGLTDPNTGTEAGDAVIFRDGQLTNLGTLPGGHQSFAQDINDHGQVAGNSSNGIPDPFSFFGWGTQTRGFIWQNGVMRDLGTLGGADTVEYVLNQRGQIAGWSYTNSTANPVTGLPTTDPYLWENGHMRDLGSLGGTFGATDWMNGHGEVVGTSDLAGDQSTHPFLWNGKHMIDLGTLGGGNGEAFWVNDAGHAVGHADLADGTHHGFLWANGIMHDLPPVNNAPCSNAFSVNARDEAVGNTTDCHGNELDAVLWSHGRAVDLNSLIAPSALHLTSAEYINDQGDIVGHGALPNGDQRIFLLMPSSRTPALATDATFARASHRGHRVTRRRPSTASQPLRDRGCPSQACAILSSRDGER